MANAVFALILLYSFIAGARRGFFKEVVHVLALIISIWAVRVGYEEGGARLAAATGGKLPLSLAEVGAGVAIWVVSFLVAAVVGRLILKKLRGKGIDDSLDQSAEALADALGGDTTKGPVTLLTDPIASKTGIFYWSDKILGAGLGLLKGLVTSLIFFGIIYYADKSRGWESSFAKSIETSAARTVYRSAVEPYLQTFSGYRIISSLDHLNSIAEMCVNEPWRFAELVNHPELRGVGNNAKIRELAKDPELLEKWRKGDLKGLLFDERVRSLLGDRELRDQISQINWEAVEGDVGSATKAAALKKVLPDGMGGTLPCPTVEDLPSAPPGEATPEVNPGG